MSDRCGFCHKQREVDVASGSYDHQCFLGSYQTKDKNKLTDIHEYYATFIHAQQAGTVCIRCRGIITLFAGKYYEPVECVQSSLARVWFPIRRQKWRGRRTPHSIGYSKDAGNFEVKEGQWAVLVTEIWLNIDKFPEVGVGDTPMQALGTALQRFGFGARIGSHFDSPATSWWLKAWAILGLIENYNDHCGRLQRSPELLVDPESILSCDISERLMHGNEQ